MEKVLPKVRAYVPRFRLYAPKLLLTTTTSIKGLKEEKEVGIVSEVANWGLLKIRKFE